MRHISTRAFTLVEVALACVITAVIAGFGLLSLVQGRQSASSRGMAEEIAEELKAARQQAVSKGVAVALAFPSAGRATGKSQSFYQLEGLAAPRLTRSMSYGDTYPQTCFYWGPWGSNAPDSTAPGPGDTEFNLATWTPLPAPTDNIVIFTPSGSVRSNGLPLIEGEYRLLVSNGVGGGEGGGGPTAVNKPHTVHITKVGGVSVTPGVAGGVGIPVQPNVPLGLVANTIPPTSSPSGGPTLRPLKSEPTPKQRTDVGNALTAVPKEGYITLVAEAEDASGQPLTMMWSGSGGKFSSADPIPMKWNAVDRVWRGSTAWTPPEDASRGQVFNLTCSVTNSSGQTVTQSLDASADIEIVDDQRIANVSADGFFTDFYLAWMNPEGNNVQNVTLPKPGASIDVVDMTVPVWAPNGDKLAFYACKALSGNSADAIFFMVNADGTNLKQVFSTRGDLAEFNFGPSFSPNGARVTFSAYDDPDFYLSSRVMVADAYGAGTVRKITAEAGNPDTFSDHIDATWNPSGDYVLYTATVYYKNDPNQKIRYSTLRAANVSDLSSLPCPSKFIAKISQQDLDESEPGVPDSKCVSQSHWSHNGDRICYIKGLNPYLAGFPTSSSRLYVIGFNKTTGYPKKANGTDLTEYGTVGSPLPVPADGLYPGEDITPSGVNHASAPRFSPDNGKVAMLNKPSITGPTSLWVVNVNGTNGLKLTNRNVSGYNWSPDGRKIAFSTSDEKMYVVDVVTGDEKEITPNGFKAWTAPTWWSPEEP